MASQAVTITEGPRAKNMWGRHMETGKLALRIPRNTVGGGGCWIRGLSLRARAGHQHVTAEIALSPYVLAWAP